MKRNQRFIAIATLILVVLSYLPLTMNVSPVMAQGEANVYEHGNRNVGPQGQKYVALTFDLCQQALDDDVWLDTSIVQVLQSTSTPATFFASGLFVQQHTADITSLANLGFEIEGHSWDHPNNMSDMYNAGVLDLNAQIGATNTLIQSATGKAPQYIRLPAGNGLNYDSNGILNGVVNGAYLKAITQTGTSVLDWDVVSGDPDAPSASYVVDNVTRSVQNGSIIVFHGNGRGVHTAEALQTLIPWFQSQGYTLVTVEQMKSLSGLEPVLSSETVVTPALPSATPTKAPAEIVASGEYHISKNVGGSYPNYTYPDYAQNMRMFFAYVTAQRDLANLPDLNHFSGSYDFIFDPTWINGVFGPYCSPQGMVDAEVGKTKMGSGACNTASMVADVMAKVPGVLVDSFSDHYWAPIPEVAPKYQLQVGTGCGSANPQAQSGNDVRIVGAKGLTLHWMIDGDLIKLWVTGTGSGPSWLPQSSDIKIYSDPETKQPANVSQPEIDWPVYLKRVLKIDVAQIDPVVKVLVVVIAICFILMLFLLAQNRQLKMKAEQKELKSYYRIRWLAYTEMFVLAVWSLFGKSEVVGILLGLAVQISVFLWISKVVARVAEFFLVNTQAIVPRLIRDMVCLVFVLSILFQTAGVAISTTMYLANVTSAQAQVQEWIPEWKRPETTIVDPVRYTGPPLANIPDGMVIPAVWDPILQAVTEEGGTPTDALKLYYIQRSECARSDYKTCVSSVGAQGPFQFMPTTWPGYSEPGWSVWDLHDSARAAYRMTKGLNILDQTTMESFRTRFCGLDGKNVWNGGSLGLAEYDGCDQAKDIWENYEAAMAKGFGAPVVSIPEMPELPVLPLLPDVNPDLMICQDPLEPCGFALPGGPGLYVKGTAAIGGKDFHENAWDYWDSAKLSSAENPIDVLSMLNGIVSEVGRFSNGGNGGGTTYLIITNERGWKQTIYHCDTNYVSQGMTVKWGQEVCLMGNQGTSDWTHLHLGITNPSGLPELDLEQWWPK